MLKLHISLHILRIHPSYYLQRKQHLLHYLLQNHLPDSKLRGGASPIYILQLRDGAFPHLEYNIIYTWRQEKKSLYSYKLIHLFIMTKIKK